MVDPKFEPLIKAILNFTSETVPDGIDKLTTEEMVEAIEHFSDEEIFTLSMERPFHKGQFGFMLNPRVFKSKEQVAEIMFALLRRFTKAKEQKQNWQKYMLHKDKKEVLKDCQTTWDKYKQDMRKLISLISIKGKSKEQVVDEVWAAFQADQQEQKSKKLQVKGKSRLPQPQPLPQEVVDQMPD
ncbi:MAG: hypothetical protein Q8P80_05675 [Candidatus Levybacteria bacterium]|nr:hypothetical protein [Candidatus Levybacteria bacterium]